MSISLQHVDQFLVFLPTVAGKQPYVLRKEWVLTIPVITSVYWRWNHEQFETSPLDIFCFALTQFGRFGFNLSCAMRRWTKIASAFDSSATFWSSAKWRTSSQPWKVTRKNSTPRPKVFKRNCQKRAWRWTLIARSTASLCAAREPQVAWKKYPRRTIRPPRNPVNRRVFWFLTEESQKIVRVAVRLCSKRYVVVAGPGLLEKCVGELQRWLHSRSSGWCLNRRTFVFPSCWSTLIYVCRIFFSSVRLSLLWFCIRKITNAPSSDNENSNVLLITKTAKYYSSYFATNSFVCMFYILSKLHVFIDPSQWATPLSPCIPRYVSCKPYYQRVYCVERVSSKRRL